MPFMLERNVSSSTLHWKSFNYLVQHCSITTKVGLSYLAIEFLDSMSALYCYTILYLHANSNMSDVSVFKYILFLFLSYSDGEIYDDIGDGMLNISNNTVTIFNYTK